MDQYINDFVNNSNGKTAIRFLECPRCRQKIYRCTRYTTILNKVHKLITQVKKKILGNKSEKEINDRRKQLIIEYENVKKKFKQINFNQSMNEFFSLLYQENNFITDDMLNLLANILVFLNEIEKILIDGRQKLQRNIFVDQVHLPLDHIIKYLFRQKYSRNFVEQQLNDIQFELERIRRLIYIENFIFSLKRTLEPSEKEGLDHMQYLIKKIGPFTDRDRQEFDDLVKKFEYLNNLPGLGINEQERKSIVLALNMSKKGHWYICPNGHPYIITEV